MPQPPARILYCRCAYAQVVPAAVKDDVLNRLAESGAAFDAVADLCEMSARRDPALKELTGDGAEVRIAACYPRAVKWLFNAAGVPINEQLVQIRNMRTESAEQVVDALLSEQPVPAAAENVPENAVEEVPS